MDLDRDRDRDRDRDLTVVYTYAHMHDEVVILVFVPCVSCLVWWWGGRVVGVEWLGGRDDRGGS